MKAATGTTPELPPAGAAAAPVERAVVSGGARRSTGVEPGATRSRAARIKEGIKTFLWVAPLTILIWVYAEREQLATSPELPVTIRLRTNAPDRVVTMLTPEDRRVYLELRGPLSSLEAVRDALADNRNVLDVTIPDDLQPPFRGPMPIAEWLNGNPVLTREAVTVSRVRPAAVTVMIEKKETVSVPVQIRAEDLARIGGSAEFQPDRVVVEGPQSVLAGARPEVYANMKKVMDLPEGPHTVDVPVEIVGNGSLAVRPNTVKAVVNIRASERKTLRQAIPVLVLINGATLSSEQYHVEIEPKLLADVTVTGPPNAIEELDRLVKDNRRFPAAIVDIAPSDLPTTGERSITKKLGADDFRMPKGVTVTNTDREVTITITAKSGN